MTSNFQGGAAEAELLRVIQERDELKVALLDFEKHMEDIQNNIKSLSNERDHFKTLFKQVSFRCFTFAPITHLNKSFCFYMI